MKIILACSLSIILLCASASAQTYDQRFEKLSADFLTGFYQVNPTSATVIGVHDYDSLLDDISLTSIELEIKRIRLFREKLLDIDLKRLSAQNAVDARLLRENLDEMLFGYEQLREFEWNPMFYTSLVGNAVASLIYQEFAPADTRLRSAAARAAAIEGLLEQARTNLKNAPTMHVETAIAQNKGNVALLQEDFPKAAASCTPEVQSLVKESSAKAVAALQKFGTWLEKDLLPRASRETRLGKELYDRKLTLLLKSSLTPADVLARALAEKQRVHREMYALALPLYRQYYGEPAPSSDTLGVIRSVLAKVVLDHPSKEAMMDSIRAIIPTLDRFIREHDLLTLDPSQPLVIRETPEYERGVSVASLESPGPLEKNLKSYYNVMPIPNDWTPEQVESFLREYNSWSIRELSIHEGVPGHFVQGYYSNRFPSVLRGVFASGSMVEGWAVFAERMMVDAGYMDGDPRMKLINLKWYIRSVLNAIIDQRIHAYGMTQQEMMDLLVREGFQEEREAAGKWRRANLTSGQLSTYFVGYQEIADLFDAWKAKKGAAFTIKEFNERFLSYGSPPVKYLRELLLGDAGAPK